jgi:hypothetical protein
LNIFRERHKTEIVTDKPELGREGIGTPARLSGNG